MFELLFTLFIGWLPGIVAEVRKHRHPMGVSLMGFVGLWLHPLLWMLALLWAWKGATREQAPISRL